jgi:hypothetical protein
MKQLNNFRRFNTTVLIALCAYLVPAGSLFASANVTVASAVIAQAVEGARAIGQARLTVYGFSIYDAKLWAADRFSVTNYATQPFALELRYLRNFKGEMIAERSLSEMRRLGEISDEKAGVWLASMKKTFPDVKKGDVLIGFHRPDGTASFNFNGRPIGEVNDPEFTRHFFGIWLSPKTSEPKMRQNLIGATAFEGNPK